MDMLHPAHQQDPQTHPNWPALLDALAEHAEQRRAPHILAWARTTARLELATRRHAAAAVAVVDTRDVAAAIITGLPR